MLLSRVRYGAASWLAVLLTQVVWPSQSAVVRTATPSSRNGESRTEAILAKAGSYRPRNVADNPAKGHARVSMSAH